MTFDKKAQVPHTAASASTVLGSIPRDLYSVAAFMLAGLEFGMNFGGPALIVLEEMLGSTRKLYLF